MTPADIKSIADAHLDAWFAADAQTSTISLREHVTAAIAQALGKQAALYVNGAETLRHERDRALAEFANELFDQRKWHDQHRTADVIVYAKDGCELAALHLSPQGRARS